MRSCHTFSVRTGLAAHIRSSDASRMPRSVSLVQGAVCQLSAGLFRCGAVQETAGIVRLMAVDPAISRGIISWYYADVD